MAAEPVHTASNKRMGQELMFLSQRCTNYQLREVAIMLHFQLCSACHTVLHMKSSTRSVSAINPVTTENMDDFCYKCREAIVCCHETTPWAVSKDKWDRKEDKGKSMVHALYILCGMPKAFFVRKCKQLMSTMLEVLELLITKLLEN